MSENSANRQTSVEASEKPMSKSAAYLAKMGIGTFGVSMPLDFVPTLKAAAKSRKISVSKFLLMCAEEKLAGERAIRAEATEASAP